MIIKKVLLQTNKVTSTGRIYPKKVVLEEINSEAFKHVISNDGLLAQIGQDDLNLGQVSVTKAAAVIKKVYFEDDILYGDVEILDNEQGKILKRLHKLWE